jgi:hypothetical protein
MRTSFLLVSIVAAVTLVAAGCGGGSLGTVPRAANTPLEMPSARPVVGHVRGRAPGTARLRPADGGQKTSIGLTLRRSAGDSLTAAVAHGSCERPRALTSTTMLGRVESRRTSWTVPTPWAQLRATDFVLVLRNGDRALASCGTPPRR